MIRRFLKLGPLPPTDQISEPAHEDDEHAEERENDLGCQIHSRSKLLFSTIKPENPAMFAAFGDPQKLFGTGHRVFPAGFGAVFKDDAFRVYKFRTSHDLPARDPIFPEVV
jgi:hypothetical protein